MFEAASYESILGGQNSVGIHKLWQNFCRVDLIKSVRFGCSEQNIYMILEHRSVFAFYFLDTKYIPLINRVRGPYGKLCIEFLPSSYGPSAKRADHENKEGKNEGGSITCRTDQANEAKKIFIIWLC